MKYIVMECHCGYAVVLDNEGRFIKVANRQYEVGQRVSEVIEMQVPQDAAPKKKVNKWLYSLAALAACLVLIVTSAFQMEQITHASVYMTINPEIRIDVNKNDVVVGLEAVNADGDALIEGYDYKKKMLDLVMDELVDKAIDMGYLHEGGQISLFLDAENDEWKVSHGEALATHLNEYLSEKLSVTIEITDKNQPDDTPANPGGSDYGESDYGEVESSTQTPADTESHESDYSENDDSQTDYKESETTDDGQTDYDEPDDTDDGQTDYGEPDDTEDSQTDYNEPDDTEDSQTDYDEPDDTDDGQSDYDEPNDTEDSQTDYDEPETTDDNQTDYEIYSDDEGSEDD